MRLLLFSFVVLRFRFRLGQLGDFLYRISLGEKLLKRPEVGLGIGVELGGLKGQGRGPLVVS
jgi:hypothetical protein